jgi:FAD binding domain
MLRSGQILRARCAFVWWRTQSCQALVHHSHPVTSTAPHAGSSQEYQKWVATEEPRWRDIWALCPPLAGRLPVERLFELCPPTPPRFYSISSSLLAQPSEVAVTVGQLAYHLPDGRKRKARPLCPLYSVGVFSIMVLPVSIVYGCRLVQGMSLSAMLSAPS